MLDLLDDYARELRPTEAEVERLSQTLDCARRFHRGRSPAQSWELGAALGALTVAVALLLWVAPDSLGLGPEAGVRGPETGALAPELAPEISLRLAVERADGSVSRLHPGQPVAMGDRIFFRISSSTPGPLTLWVEGPEGRQRLSRLSPNVAGTVDVPSGNGLMSWRFDAPGAYRFTAMTGDDERCLAGTCAHQRVTAEE